MLGTAPIQLVPPECNRVDRALFEARKSGPGRLQLEEPHVERRRDRASVSGPDGIFIAPECPLSQPVNGTGGDLGQIGVHQDARGAGTSHTSCQHESNPLLLADALELRRRRVLASGRGASDHANPFARQVSGDRVRNVLPERRAGGGPTLVAERQHGGRASVHDLRIDVHRRCDGIPMPCGAGTHQAEQQDSPGCQGPAHTRPDAAASWRGIDLRGARFVSASRIRWGRRRRSVGSPIECPSCAGGGSVRRTWGDPWGDGHAVNTKRAHKVRDVLDSLLAQVLERRMQAVTYRLLGRARNRQTARLSQSLKPRGDIDAVAIDRAVVLFSDVSYMHADAKTHLTIIRKVRSELAQPLLNPERRGHGSDGGFERREDRIPGHVDHAALM